ncbi:MAG: hypothetical protein AAF433_10810 [Bacteroidota bacterium]
MASPYHNRRLDITNLATVLSNYEEVREVPVKTALWKLIYPKKDFIDSSWRLLLSALSQQLERFVAVESILDDEFELKIKVAGALEERLNTALHDKLLRESHRILEKQEVRNAEYWLREYRYQEAYYRRALTRQPEKDDHFGALSRSADRAFLAMKFRQNMWLLNHEQVYKWGFEPTAIDSYTIELSEEQVEDIPALRLYYYGIQMLRQPENEVVFQRFSNSLFTQAIHLPKSEARDLYLLAINFAVRQLNSGKRAYFPQVMDLYQSGLEQGYLLRKGVLSRFTYHNIVTTALQIQDIDYAEAFIEQWTGKLERRYRERMYNFNRAKIAYTSQRYGDALPLLQQANYHDPLLNLGARTLLLKIYFELGEREVLQSHLDAFTSYLRRKPGISYHRTNYRNLIRFTRKLLKIEHSSETEKEKLRQQINNTATLTEKSWLLACLC